MRPVSKPSFSTSPVIRAVRSCAWKRCERLAKAVAAPHPVLHCLNERMLGREHQEVRAEDRVDARREDLNGIRWAGASPGSRVRDREIRLSAELHPRALRPPDPVPLHRQNLLGPVLETLRRFEQLVGVVGDAEEPLIELADRHDVPQRQHLPSMTCSFASTVLQLGHQLTFERLRNARSRSSILRNSHWFQW